jgi:hypothetical protein
VGTMQDVDTYIRCVGLLEGRWGMLFFTFTGLTAGLLTGLCIAVWVWLRGRATGRRQAPDASA